MTEQLELVPGAVPGILMAVRWTAQRKPYRAPKQPLAKLRCDLLQLLSAINATEDFEPAHFLLGGSVALNQGEFFRDLLLLRAAGLVKDFGPDQWHLTAEGESALADGRK